MAFLRGFLIVLLLAVIGIGIVAALNSDPDIPHEVLVEKYGQAPSKFLPLPSGANVHYRDQGNLNGPVLVMLHGSNASLHTWEPWVAQLGDTFRMISLDLPSHGLTGAIPSNDYSQDAMARFVDEFTRTLGVDRFALAGNSMGGGIAARFALIYPQRLTHLILIDASGMSTKMPQDPGLGFRIARTPVIQNLMLYVTPRSLFESSLKTAIYDDALVTPAMVDRYWELNRHAGNRPATLKRFQLPQDTYIQEHVSEITTPTLILWGDQDTLTPRDMGEGYNAAIKGSKLIIYREVGHLPMEEAPDRSARAVRDFLTPPPMAVTPVPPQP